MKLRLLTLILSLFATAAPVFAWPRVFSTGTTSYDPELAHNGYILFSTVAVKASYESTVFLINMRGDVVHGWDLPFNALSARLLPNGNLVVLGMNPQTPPGRPGFGKFWMGGAAGTIAEVDWEGKRVFMHRDLNMHHDAVKLPNGNYLYLAWEQVPKALQAKIRGGRKGTSFPGGVMFNDYLVEVDAKGKTVWKWHANDHLDPDIDIIGNLYDRGEWCHFNSVEALSNGNILLTSRETDSMMVVERKTGKIIWRWGNFTYLDKQTGRLEYRSSTEALGGPHSGAEIPQGYPGAGNLICYDNGLYEAISRAVEVNPKTGKMVWQSNTTQWVRRPFSWFLGSAQRLPNGNTLICEGGNGRLYQVTPKRKIVWEYIGVYGASHQLPGAMLKAYQYAPDYCPQFKSLPAAEGAAIVPPVEEGIPGSSASSQVDLLPLTLALAVIASVASLIAVYLWRKHR